MLFPKCTNGFKQWLKTNKKWELVYNSLGTPSLFDITLRDCNLKEFSSLKNKPFIVEKNSISHKSINLYNTQLITGMSADDIITNNEKYKLQQIEDMYHKIYFNYIPKSIEICSVTNYTNIFFNYIKKYQKNIGQSNYPNYVLVPNKQKLTEIINSQDINHLSFITSVSDSFQIKNTKKTIVDNENEILLMINMLDINSFRVMDAKIKLYVYCINYCPIEGKIDNDFIVNKLLKLNKIKVDSICLTDTYGKLTCDDFEYIVDNCNFFGLPYSKFSLHLCVNKDRESEVEKIIYMALDRKIIDFDVSMSASSDSSVSILSYELYYKALVKYIIYKTENQ
jgi:hypothetical protein